MPDENEEKIEERPVAEDGAPMSDEEAEAEAEAKLEEIDSEEEAEEKDAE